MGKLICNYNLIPFLQIFMGQIQFWDKGYRRVNKLVFEIDVHYIIPSI